MAQLGSGDNVAVFAFDNTITKVRDFTSDRAAINAAIDSVQAGGNTALFAAAVQAAQALAPKSGRKAIILLTDGRNNEAGHGSGRHQPGQTGERARFSRWASADVDDAVLGRLASGTGGVYKKGATSAELQGILQGIGQTISSQYEIIYTTSNSLGGPHAAAHAARWERPAARW